MICFKRRLYYLLLAGCGAYGLMKAQAPVLSHETQTAIARATNPQVITSYIQRGNELAAKYADPIFLNQFLNPEQQRQQKQQAFNDTHLYTMNGVGVYMADALRIAYFAGSWGLEFFLYTQITSELNNIYAEHIISHYNQPIPHLITLNKNILIKICAYAVVRATLMHSREYLLLTKTSTKHQPKALSECLPDFVTTGWLESESWSQYITTTLRKIGFIPEWTTAFSYTVAKEFVVTLMWLWYYERYTIRPAFTKLCNQHQQEFSTARTRLQELLNKENCSEFEHKEHDELSMIINQLVCTTTREPFIQWASHKAFTTALCSGIVSVCIATPAWCRLGKWIHQICATQPTGKA